MNNSKKCWGCGATEDLESTKYIDIHKDSWYDEKQMAVVTRKTTTKSERLLCKSCITKAKKFSKKVLLTGIVIILLGVVFNIYVEIFQAPGFFGRLFLKDEPLDYLDIIPLIIIGVGFIIIYYGNRLKTQPSRYF